MWMDGVMTGASSMLSPDGSVDVAPRESVSCAGSRWQSSKAGQLAQPVRTCKKATCENLQIVQLVLFLVSLPWSVWPPRPYKA